MPSDRFLDLIPHEFSREHLILSAGQTQGNEQLLISEHTQPAAIFNTGTRLGTPLQTQLAPPEQLARWIDAAYTRYTSTHHDGNPDPLDADDVDSDIEKLLAHADRDLLSTQGKGPVVKLVDALLFEALGMGASDVHIQPLADRTVVRYRVDGVLHTARELPAKVTASVISRIKVMGKMDIAERRMPQDGRATVTIGATPRSAKSSTVLHSSDPPDQPPHGNRSIDLRISTLPTSYGERAVIRLLDNTRGTALADFGQLGMSKNVQAAYLDRAGRANGIVLLTGPTGSGKTTTLYATLRWIASRDAGLSGGAGALNVMTIEDPIEYELSTAGVAISQAQVNTKKGLTFATGLRHILRQDPDVVMVGEIRDAETARIAIQASLTGHLVFSTLHTNDAAGAAPRLIDLGVEPYLVGASLSAVLAQRLVRTVHAQCAGAGCKRCFNSGLLGRSGLFELLVATDAIREAISAGTSGSALRLMAREAGMHSLEQEGRRLVEAGQTTELEVHRVVQGVQ